MLQLPIIALFLRTIPEGILLIFANYVITNTKIDKKKMVISGILLGISTYLVRLLPIHFGVHTIILLMVYILLSVKMNHIDFYKAVGSSIICVIVMFCFEWITVTIAINILGIIDAGLLGDPLMNILCGLPSLVVSYLAVLTIFYIKNNRRKRVI